MLQKYISPWNLANYKYLSEASFLFSEWKDKYLQICNNPNQKSHKKLF